MKVISLLSEKGGVGRTTLTINIGRAFQLKNYKILFIDSDPQRTLADWRTISGDESDYAPVISASKTAEIDQAIADNAEQHDLIFIDGPPGITTTTAAIIRLTDVAIVPCSPSPFDLWAGESMAELIKARQRDARGRPAAAFIIVRQVQGTRLAGEIRQALADYGLPVLTAGTVHRVIYPSSAAEGQTVFEADRTGPAAQEINDIAGELQKWL